MCVVCTATSLSACENGPVASARFAFITGLAVDRCGVLYVCDYENHCVRKLDPCRGIIKKLIQECTFLVCGLLPERLVHLIAEYFASGLFLLSVCCVFPLLHVLQCIHAPVVHCDSMVSANASHRIAVLLFCTFFFHPRARPLTCTI